MGLKDAAHLETSNENGQEAYDQSLQQKTLYIGVTEQLYLTVVTCDMSFTVVGSEMQMIDA